MKATEPVPGGPTESVPGGRTNPFTPPPGAPVGAKEFAALVARFRNQMLWLTIAFVLMLIGLAGFDIWATNELVSHERFQLDQTKSIVIEQAKKFRTELTTQEQNLRQIIQNAELQSRNLQGMASNASLAFAQVLSNNLGTAVLANTAATASRTVVDDALAIRNNRRAAQEIEVELRLSLERTRESFRSTASNLLSTYTIELNSSLKSVKQRAYEADLLVAQLKQVETEVKKTRQSVETVLNALRQPIAPQPPATTQPPATPVPAPAVPPATVPATAVPRPAAQAAVTSNKLVIQNTGAGPGFTIPVPARPQSNSAPAVPAAPGK